MMLALPPMLSTAHAPSPRTARPRVAAPARTTISCRRVLTVLTPRRAVTAESRLTISSLVAVPVEDLDAEAVKLGLAQYSDAYAKATEDMAKCEAEIGMEVYQAMAHALAE